MKEDLIKEKIVRMKNEKDKNRERKRTKRGNQNYLTREQERDKS